MRNEQAEPGTKRSLLCPPRGRRCPWPRSLAASAIGLIGVLAVNFAALVLSLKVGALLGLQPGMPVRRPGTGALLLLTEGMVCPVIEEILFRGLWFGGLRRRFGFWGSALFPSLAFGLIHGRVTAMAAFLSGMLLCDLYERTGRLIMPIVVHVANNLLVLWLPVSSKGLTEPGMLPLAALALLVTALAVYTLHHITEGFYCLND